MGANHNGLELGFSVERVLHLHMPAAIFHSYFRVLQGHPSVIVVTKTTFARDNKEMVQS